MASSAVIGALRVTLGADTAAFSTGIRSALTDFRGHADGFKREAAGLSSAFSKINIGEALKKGFDSSRLAVIEEGSAKLRVFGSALEPLGPLGIGVAVGLAALGAAFEGVRSAAEFADKLADSATRLHETTDALQEFRQANRLAGGEIGETDGALESFEGTLGKAQAGLPRALKAFSELGFTEAQVKGFRDTEAALAAVSDRIAKLSAAQKTGVEDQLGLTGIKALVEQGSAGMDALKAKAASLGLVMSEDVVRRGGELNDQFETLGTVINVQLKTALIELGPAMLAIATKAAEAATGFARVAAEIRDAGGALRPMVSTLSQIIGLLNQGAQKNFLPGQKEVNGSIDQLVGLATAAGVAIRAYGKLQNAKAGISDLLSGKGLSESERAAMLAQYPGPAATGKLADPNAAAKAAKAEAAARKAEEQALAREELALKAQIDAAEKAGDLEKVQSLKDELELRSRIKAYLSAGLPLAQATATAEHDLAGAVEARAKAYLAAQIEQQNSLELTLAQQRGDQAAVDILSDQAKYLELMAKARKAGVAPALAARTAEEGVARLAAGRQESRDKELAAIQLRVRLQAASLAGNISESRALQLQADTQAQIATYIAQGLIPAEATRRATADMLMIANARVGAAVEQNRLDTLEQQLAIATAQGDADSVKYLQQQLDILQETVRLRGQGYEPADAKKIATATVDGLADAKVKGAWRTTVNDGFKAALDGNLGGFVTDWLKTYAEKGFKSALNSLSDVLEGLFNKLGSGFGAKIESAVQGAAAGLQIGSASAAAIGGNKQLGSTLGAVGGAIGSFFGGPIGSAIGSVAGGLLGGLLGGSKKRDEAAQAADVAALNAAKDAAVAAGEAATAAAEKLRSIAETHNNQLIAFLSESGDAAGALAATRKQELAALDESNRSLQEAIYGWQDYNAALDAAKGALRTAFDAQSAVINGTIQGLQSAATALDGTRTTFKGFVDSLDVFRQSLTTTALASNPAAQLQALGSQFQATARATLGGDQKAFGVLQKQGQDYLTVGQATAKTALDYLREVAQVREATVAAEGYASDQVDAATEALAQNAAQIQIATDSLASLKAQVDAVLGVNDSVLSVRDAINNLAGVQARGATDANGNPLGAPSRTAPAYTGPTTPDWSVGGAMWNAWANGGAHASSVASGNQGAAVLANWRRDAKLFYAEYSNAQAVGSLSVLDAVFGLPPGSAADMARSYSLPAFATGGSFRVGGVGGIDSQIAAMRLTPGEHVNVSKRDTMADVASITGELVRKVEALKTGIEQIVKNTGAGSRILQAWDGDGQPPERIVTP